ELTLAIDDMAFTKEMYWLQQGYIEESHIVDVTKWSQRTLSSRFLERVFYLFNPLL
ncbi:cardiolipin synthase A, partial [Vibrio sp. M260118]